MSNENRTTRNRRPALRMRQRARQIGVAAGAMGLVLGSSVLTAGASQANVAASEATTGSDAQVNASLDTLAKAFAAAGSDSGFRQSIHDAAAKRFDGDTEALWSTLSAERGVRGALAAAYGAKTSMQTTSAYAEIDRLAATIPRFQVAVPNKLDDWNPATYEPLVAYVPVGIDDDSLKTITAYNRAGKAVQLDAQVEPKNPVIVLGLNERTNDAGDVVVPQSPAVSKQSASKMSTSAAAARTAYQVRIVKLRLLDDKEPWAKGNAEIAMVAKSVGCSGTNYTDTNWAGLDVAITTQVLSREVGFTKCDVIFYWWEDDGGSYDFGLTYGGVSLGVQMDDEDDLIGGAQLPYSSFAGGTDKYTEWSALEMWTD